MIYREAGVKKLDLGAVAYPVIGILGVVLLALIPSGLFTPDGSFGARGPAPSAGWGIHHCGGAGPARNQRVTDALHAGNL